MDKKEKRFINIVICITLLLFLIFKSILWIYLMGGLIFLAPFIFKRANLKIIFLNTLFFILFCIFVYFFNSMF
ncbi:hypothetical protein CN354_15170 [Bacillus cereus]|nr:hypothetical protein CN354_15170 [Bacillus cereus]